ncbi:MAG: (2Fe-2S)-binding protein [Kordiimonadaceae bacterium]|nr:(2Fe-2S)-binding protein [Kordiimonadaceae bacterium]MBO6567362.1 (2Fe-2S)-binding protein [Kordiimonadaceae bacterium]MBO6963424.1 (2Fe-2S)-binding protein [Kordiimonadaceae bacterium]
MPYTLKVNGETRTVDVEPDTPLLWVLRDELGFKGVKFGCGVAACGACTVHMDGAATRTCVYPVEAAEDIEITTIEGLSDEGMFTDVQQAWIDEQVPQCGYCQSGMVMAVSALLDENPAPTDEDINDAISNVCRCGSYPRIKKAIKKVISERGAA